jgi:NAD(P)-dependent dehydrogenase (short-subunit alcohol dehydrogenase family)
MRLLNKILVRLKYLKVLFFLNPNPCLLFLSRLYCRSSHRASKYLVVGGDSDIAKAFISLLAHNNIPCLKTSRSAASALSDSATLHLDFNDLSTLANLRYLADCTGITHVIFFTGLLDSSSDQSLSDETKSLYSKSFVNTSASFYDNLSVNTLGPFLVCKILGSYFLNQSQPNVTFSIVTSSIGSSVHDVFPGMYFYRGSKAALHNMLMSLFLELNISMDAPSLFSTPPFTFLLLGPGSVKTRMNPLGTLTPEHSAHYLFVNICRFSRSGFFSFISHLGKRLYV